MIEAGVAEQWVLQPLVDAGLPVRELGELLFRVAFAGMAGGRELDRSLREVVADRPASVRAAWIETIDRMLAVR